MTKFKVFTDGGSRGNPGPAAIGVVIQGDEIGKKSYCEFLGKATNNEAEYRAVIFGLKKLKQLLGGDKAGQAMIDFYVDSELIERQLNGQYKIKEKNLQKFFMEIWNLRLDFRKVVFNHVLRGKNSEADRLVNQALDREASHLDI